MKKFFSKIFSVAVISALAVSPVLAQQLAKNNGARAALSPTTVTMKAQASQDKSESKSKGRKGLTDKRTVSKNGFSTQKTEAPRPSVRRNIVNAAAGNYPEIYGGLLYSDAWDADEDEAYGIYSIPTAGQDFDETIIFDSGSAPFYGAAVKDGIYYFNDYTNFFGVVKLYYSYGIDLETGEQVYFYNYSTFESPVQAMGMDLDPLTNEIYGIFINDDKDGLELAKVSYPSTSQGAPTKTTIASLGDASYTAFAINKDGTFYAILQDDVTGEGILGTINRTTGAFTKIGNTGEYPYNNTGMVCDKKSGRLFWTLSLEDGTGYLVEINPATGATTRVNNFENNEQVAGLYIPVSTVADDAPAACENINFTFEATSLTGKINVTTPTKTVEGNEIQSTVTLHVLANGTEILTEAGLAAGVTKTLPITVSAAGLYDFIVYVSNEAGDGVKTSVKNVLVGADTPAATTATAEYKNGNMEITWLPVTEGINGSQLSDVTYTVKDDQGNVLASGLTGTSYSFAFPMPDAITSYYYEVYVVAGGMTSAAARTNSVVVGSIVPPYIPDFKTDGLQGWTIIDGNNDGKTWQAMDTGTVRMTYNSNWDMDDWLITPPLKLDAGKSYVVSFMAASASNTIPEALEVKWGNDKTEAGMTNTLLDKTIILSSLSDGGETFEKGLVPQADGVYYIGFHGVSDADKFYLYIGDIAVQAAVSGDAPAEATNVMAIPDANGALKATVSFNAPSKTMSGNILTNLTKVEVLRGSTVIKTFDNPTPGEALTYTDNEAPGGEVTYSVIGYNADGEGLKASATCFVGFDLPEAPQKVNISRTSVEGQVLLTWDAVTKDVNGATLNANDVTYTVCKSIYGWDPIVEDLSECTYSYQAVEEGEQDFVQLAVYAKTTAGLGYGSVSEMIPVGTPYNGIDETFADTDLHYIWGNSGTATVNLADDSTIEDITSVGGDNGLLYMQASYADFYGSLFSGLVNLNQIENPGLTFYTYNIKGDLADINEITVEVRVDGQSEWTKVLDPTTVDALCGGVEGWNKVSVSLGAYTNKVIQFRITSVVKNYSFTMFDDIKVGSILGHDLAANSISGPAKTKTGSEYTIDVKVINEGAQTAASYYVELYANEELVATQEDTNLEGGKSQIFQFKQTMPAIATEDITYFAKVVYAQDENDANNQTSDFVVAPVVSTLPVAADLEASVADNGVMLTWTEPNLEDVIVEPITDDFEEAEAFAAEYGDWTFADVDKKMVGGFSSLDMPGIIPGQTTGSFWIWDNTVAMGNQTFDGHSGSNYLFALYLSDDTQSDDWAISPELYGGAQTISFYAKSYSEDYPEKITVYASSTGKELDDFGAIEGTTVNAVPSKWTRYDVELPEGTKYFAIRSYATGSFMLMVDDVTYTPASNDFSNLEISGFNVYRDGVKVNETPVEETSYVDTTAISGETHTYQVTVVYTDKGESAGSNLATIKYQTDGIDYTLATNVEISVDGRTIVVSNAEGQNVAVYTASGLLLHNGNGDARVNVDGGVYIVKVGDRSVKVLVK